MRMTRHKKQILELYKPEYRDWVRVEAGDPPFDVRALPHRGNTTNVKRYGK